MSDEKNYRKEKRRSPEIICHEGTKTKRFFLDLPCDESMGEKESVQ